MKPDDAGFGIYVHWPFCRSKCPYCDFNSHVRERVEQEQWRDALLAELDRYAEVTAGRTVGSVFFGGGTPSLMPPATVAAVLDRIAARWPAADNLEVTLEANPTSVEAANFAALATAGVNRVSLGVQALNDADLLALGRQHSADEALHAVGVAQQHFARFSFDLIYARPGQSVAAWQAELQRALDHAAAHLSVYQLTIEPGTVFEGRYRRGELQIPDEHLAADLYEATQALLNAAGRPSYEVSNHARPGEECRHNLTYWRYGDYVGIGPGAHGRLTIDGVKQATRAHRAPEIWLERVATRSADEWTVVTHAERASECLMMGLRLSEGVPVARLEAEAAMPFEDIIAPEALARMQRGGFVSLRDGRIFATDEGRQRLDAVLAALLT